MILAFGGPGGPGDRSGPMRDYHLGGTQVAFAASGWARAMTAAIVNVSCGALID